METAVSLEPVVVGSSGSKPSWELHGAIPSAKVSPLYKLGMAAVATSMVLLPLLYVALIAGVAYGTYRYGIGSTRLFETTGNEMGKLLLYIGPLIIGVLVVLFMIKPLFARSPKRVEPREITRSDEPALFDFIDSICDLVCAPRPSRVQLDLQVNASASFRRGFFSLFGNDLTLTIGLPLVAGLTARQFGGVLAHEFGHFAQGAGMRLTYVIRSVNAWFARVVFERDAWDERLADTASNIDLRIGIVLHLARLMIWLTRKVLWVFMAVGHGISCFMLRQMEFDADHYEAQTAGSSAFAQTAARLRQLSVGWQRTLAQQQEAFQSKRLVDNLPSLIALETHRLPDEVRTALDDAAGKSKTGWFDTHPSDQDRVRAAERAGAEGVLQGETNATALFADFSATARACTGEYYRQECEIDLGGVQLFPVETMAAEASAEAAAGRRMNDCFGNLLTIRSLLFINPLELRAAPDTAPTPDRAELAALHSAAEPAVKALIEADSSEVLAHQARALLSAGFKIKKEEFKLTAAQPEAAETALSDARVCVKQHRSAFADAFAASRSGFLTALRRASTEDATGRSTEIAQLVMLLGRIEEAKGAIVGLRNSVAALEILLQNASNAADGLKWSNAAKPLATDIESNIVFIFGKMQGLDYPFAHGSGRVALVDFLGECDPHENQFVRAFLRGRAVLDRLLNTYQRTLSRLATLAAGADADALREPPTV